MVEEDQTSPASREFVVTCSEFAFHCVWLIFCPLGWREGLTVSKSLNSNQNVLKPDSCGRDLKPQEKVLVCNA